MLPGLMHDEHLPTVQLPKIQAANVAAMLLCIVECDWAPNGCKAPAAVQQGSGYDECAYAAGLTGREAGEWSSRGCGPS